MPTNVYDTTQPPDTQLANLLGLDLRNLALNVQERMALISGLLANIWNPATDAQPLKWTGLLYFATDTHQVFQWSGAAWVDVSGSFSGGTILKDSVPHVHTGDTTEDVIYTATVGANTMSTSGIVRGIVIVDTIAPNSGSIFIRFGGVLTGVVGFTSSFSNRIDFTIGNKGATGAQFWSITVYNTTGVTLIDGSIAVDTTVVQNVTIAAKNANNTDTQTFRQCLIQSV